jgi:hypothetical protein
VKIDLDRRNCETIDSGGDGLFDILGLYIQQGKSGSD